MHSLASIILADPSLFGISPFFHFLSGEFSLFFALNPIKKKSTCVATVSLTCYNIDILSPFFEGWRNLSPFVFRNNTKNAWIFLCFCDVV